MYWYIHVYNNTLSKGMKRQHVYLKMITKLRTVLDTDGMENLKCIRLKIVLWTYKFYLQ